MSTRIANNAGPATEDRVFLLSMEEAKRLFADDNDRMVVPSVYAIKHDVCTSMIHKIGRVGCCWWWLRSRGWTDNCAAGVNYDGGVNDSGRSVSSGHYAVRPAFKIAL